MPFRFIFNRFKFKKLKITASSCQRWIWQLFYFFIQLFSFWFQNHGTWIYYSFFFLQKINIVCFFLFRNKRPEFRNIVVLKLLYTRSRNRNHVVYIYYRIKIAAFQILNFMKIKTVRHFLMLRFCRWNWNIIIKWIKGKQNSQMQFELFSIVHKSDIFIKLQ